MAVRHLVMFDWNDDVDDAHVAEVTAALAELPAMIPEIRDYRCGPDLGLNEGNADYAVTALFDDDEAYRTYRDHPGHRDVIARLIAPHVASRTAVQLHTDE